MRHSSASWPVVAAWVSAWVPVFGLAAPAVGR